jgi:two-component system, cell cycle response regulator DivK
MLHVSATQPVPRFQARLSANTMNNEIKTILLVEDNEDNLVVYRTILEHVGYRVVEARDGEEGIARAQETSPDLILMDISIPKMDGWEATQRLKADEATRNIPIIALTAHALEEDRQKAAQAGCDGYLAKPVEPRRVVQEVERFVGPARQQV